MPRRGVVPERRDRTLESADDSHRYPSQQAMDAQPAPYSCQLSISWFPGNGILMKSPGAEWNESIQQTTKRVGRVS